MRVGILEIDIFIPQANSLKFKRQILSSIKDRLRNRFNVSVAEEGNNLWQRSKVYIACINSSSVHIEKTLSAVKDYVSNDKSLEILNTNLEIL